MSFDRSVYHHRQGEPALRGLLATFVFLLGMMAVGSFASSRAGMAAGCPRFLGGRLTVSSICVYSPISGLAWDIRYRWLHKPKAIAEMRTLARDRRYAFLQALVIYDASAVAGVFLFGGVSMLLFMALNAFVKPPRPKLHGTRFWATTEEVMESGLAVGYKPPFWKRKQNGS